MKINTTSIIQKFIENNPKLEDLREEIEKTVETIKTCFASEGKLLVCGNGGSCSDAAHITGELMKSFRLPRKIEKELEDCLGQFPDGEFLTKHLQKGLPCIDLTANTALQTAILNDTSPDLIFAQQLFVYGQQGDVLLALSTSGNSRNVCLAAQVAKLKKIKVIALQGGNKSSFLSQFADHLIAVPEKETYLVQEFHLPIYHTICLCLENEFFGDN